MPLTKKILLVNFTNEICLQFLTAEDYYSIMRGGWQVLKKIYLLYLPL